MKTLAILTAFLLSSCAGFDKDGNPNPIWVSENLCIGMMCPGSGGKTGYQEPAFGVGGMADSRHAADFARFRAEVGEPNVKRNDPNEKPRVEYVKIRENVSQIVHIYDQNCVGGDGGSYFLDTPGIKKIYLCGRKSAEEHELKHAAGMRHTEWEKGGGAACATVTVAGYKTGYAVGDRICRANDHEWKEAAK